MDGNASNEALQALSGAELQAIVNALAGLRFGEVTIVIHDGRIVRIDRTESQRIGRPEGGSTRVRPGCAK